LNKAIASLWGLLLAGCGTGFESSAEVNSLRVLGVQKDQPYATPGSSVTLRMLWYDGKVPDGSREIHRFWTGGDLLCTNPAGDLYYACYPQILEKLLQALAGVSGAPVAGADGGGGADAGISLENLPLEIPIPDLPNPDETTVFIPKEIISDRGTPPGGQVPYGLSYVFFGVCAGQMYVKLDIKNGFPVVCKDASGQYLGADDFVAGYSSIYSYYSVSNTNPAINGFELDGQTRQAAEEGVCVGTDCTLPQLHPSDAEGQAMPRIPACADDGAEKCPAHRIQVWISPTCTTVTGEVVDNCAEKDQLAYLQGTPLGEQMWVRYFSERGTIQSAVRLLNDARQGWMPEFAGKLRAPKDKGPMFVWAVVQDSRGGEQWVRQTVFVE
jgi:hypothetical protein